MGNKKDYKTLYGELDIKYDCLLERHISMSQVLWFIRDLIKDLKQTKKYDDVYNLMSKYVIDDIQKIVLDAIDYENTFCKGKQQNDE